MPLFSYRCEACDHDFEDLVRATTPDSEVECPECGAHEAQRKLSAFSTVRGLGACGQPTSGCGGGSGFR